MTRPLCKTCNKNPCEKQYGRDAWRSTCSPCRKRHLPLAKTAGKKKRYRRAKKDFCEFCGFKAIHPVQLDVDHKDGNKNNESADNLQTLCANCHRLKTLMSKDYTPKY